MNNYANKILFEKCELDCFKQRQIREMLPEVNNMEISGLELLRCWIIKTMPADAIIRRLKTIQTQCDKLHKDIGWHCTGRLTRGTSEPAVNKVNNDTAVNKTNAPPDNVDTTD